MRSRQRVVQQRRVEEGRRRAVTTIHSAKPARHPYARTQRLIKGQHSRPVNDQVSGFGHMSLRRIEEWQRGYKGSQADHTEQERVGSIE